MKRLNAIACTAALLVFSVGSAFAGTAKEDAVDRLDKASDVLKEIMNAPDKGVPQEVVDNAKCIAVVPNLVKAGFIFGAKHGKGVATCRTATGWSAPSFFTVTGGSWGAQIGAEGIDLVMMVMNEKGMSQLLADKFQIGADASASAGPVGRHVSGQTDWKLGPQILTYSRSKGLFAGITLEGAGVRQDDDSTQAIYGMSGPSAYKRILLGQVAPPATTRAFLANVRTASGKSAVHEEKQGELPSSDKDNK